MNEKDQSGYYAFPEDNSGHSCLDACELSMMIEENFANLAHDMKAGMTLLLNSITNLKVLYGSTHMEVADKNWALMQHTVSKILFLTDLTADTGRGMDGMPMHPYWYDLAGYLQHFCDLLHPTLAIKNLSVNLKCERYVDWFYCDIFLMDRLLGNLISNACYHTPANGSISIRLYRTRGALCIDVQDTGCGIAEAVLPRIFERYFTTKSGSVGGLGLWLVKQIALKHSGDVTVDSKLGAGSCFTVTLPVVTPNPRSDEKRHYMAALDYFHGLQRLHGDVGE